MRQLLVSCLLLMTLVVGSADAKNRFRTYQGAIYDTLFNTDTSKGNLSKILVVNEPLGEYWDGMIGWIYTPAFVAVSTNAQLGDVDTVSITMYSGSGYKQQLMQVQVSGATPDTMFFQFSRDIWTNGALAKSTDSTGLDTVSITWRPATDSLSSLFLWDHFWFLYHVGDTSGSEDTIATEIQYWFRFYEDD